MKAHAAWWCVLAACAAGQAFDLRWTRVLRLPQGRLRGIAADTHNKYLGIPYARVTKRFQMSSPSPSWRGVFKAVGDRFCWQTLFVMKMAVGTEDCLILNVYTPQTASPSAPVPVMLYIHGGGFAFGISNSLVFGPEPLVERGVVVVTATYRLGAAGFLCLGLEEAPGNIGLKDLVVALRWVRDNIRAFGGDPNSVTIFGESAGATAAHYLMFSPMSKGLFHKAILESNSGLSPSSFTFDPIEKASRVAAKLGRKTKDPRKLLAVFSNAKWSDIVLATVSDDILTTFAFVPCVEKRFPGVEALLTRSPHEYLSSGNFTKVPTVIGHNEKEGTLFVGVTPAHVINDYKKHFYRILPKDIDFRTEKDKSEAEGLVTKFYFGGRDWDAWNKTEQLIDLISDAYFHFGNVRASEFHAARNAPEAPIYNYYYTYDSSRNIGKGLSRLPHIKGPTHFDEAYFLFRPSIRFAPLSGRDLTMASRLSKIWTDFAKTSNPTPAVTDLIPLLWLPSDATGLRFYNLDDELRMRDLPNRHRIDLWRRIYDTYGYKHNI